MFKPEPFLESPPPDASLWRYMDFTKFLALLEHSSLFFARVDKLGDPFEGYLPTRVLENLRNTFNNNSDPADNIYWNITQVFRTFAAFTLVSCWHESSQESMAMWKLYSKEADGVAIKTTFASLSESLQCDEDVFVGRINYVDYDAASPIGILDDEDRLFKGPSADPLLKLRSSFFHKRKAFEHEKEVRALHPLSMWGLFPGGMTKELPEPDCGVGKNLRVELPQLIKQIVVSPICPAWMVELVESAAARHNLLDRVTRSSLTGEPVWT